jgi:hypothetical protein
MTSGTELSSLTAAELSWAAYTPLEIYVQGANQDGFAPITLSTDSNEGSSVVSATLASEGWVVDTTSSGTDAANNNQFITFVNASTRQVVITFKGSNKPSNYESDAFNSGGQEWEALAAEFDLKFRGTVYQEGIEQKYSGYTIVTDGHSLGGGMAQTAALENDLSGYGQNALPVSQEAINIDGQIGGSNNFGNVVTQWKKNYTFIETNTAGDPATFVYSLIHANQYISTSTNTLADPYESAEAFGGGLIASLNFVAGAVIGAYGTYEAHRIGTVVSALQATSSSSETQSGITQTELASIFAQLQGSTETLNSDGSVTVTTTNGQTISVNASSSNLIPILNSGQSFVFNPAVDAGYTITGDGSSVVAFDPASGGELTFTQVSSIGTGDITLPDGTPVPVSEDGGLQLTGIATQGASSESVLLNYLSSVGAPTTAAQLEQDNYAFLNPNGTAHTLNSYAVATNANNTAADVYFAADAPGAIITGQNTATISVYNSTTHSDEDISIPSINTLFATNTIFYPTVDISTDTISDIQRLGVYGCAVELTASQFDEFVLIEGSGTLIATTPGTFDISGSKTDGEHYNLSADGFGGTTLIGNNVANETLTASNFGDDTLVAGNGSGDRLTAGDGDDILRGGNGGDIFTLGDGVDTVTGGTGDDTFIIYGTPSPGTTITGGGGKDTIEGNCDLTGVTISGVQTLSADDTLTVAELGQFNKVSGFQDIEDTAANILNSLPLLIKDVGDIAHIVSTDTQIVMSVATYLSTYAAASLLSQDVEGGIAIDDTASNIENGLSSLEYLKVASITSTDTPVSVTVAQLSSALSSGEEGVLNEIVGGFVVSDTAANIENGWLTLLDGLNLATYDDSLGGLASITSNDGPIVLSVDDYLKGKSAWELVTGGVTISDTAADIQAFQSAINDGIADDVITSVLTSDDTLSVGSGDALTVTGNGDRVEAQAGASVVLSGTGDTALGSDFSVALTSTEARVIGGGNTVYLNGNAGDTARLLSTAGALDIVHGTGGAVDLLSAQAKVVGGSDIIRFLGTSDDLVKIAGTGVDLDTVHGSDGVVDLLSAQAKIVGGSDSIHLLGGSDDLVRLLNTSGEADVIHGSGGIVDLLNAQARVVGGDNTLRILSGTNDLATLLGTDGNADIVHGSGATVTLLGAQASISGSDDTIKMFGTGDTVTVNGAHNTFVFQPAFGQDTISGFASTDLIKFSTADFANWSALSPDISQSGANTVIQLDASDTLTLLGVTATSLSQSEFRFVA